MGMTRDERDTGEIKVISWQRRKESVVRAVCLLTLRWLAFPLHSFLTPRLNDPQHLQRPTPVDGVEPGKPRQATDEGGAFHCLVRARHW